MEQLKIGERDVYNGVVEPEIEHVLYFGFQVVIWSTCTLFLIAKMLSIVFIETFNIEKCHFINFIVY